MPIHPLQISENCTPPFYNGMSERTQHLSAIDFHLSVHTTEDAKNCETAIWCHANFTDFHSDNP